MTKLSVNVNKIATLRNSRGGGVPSVIRAVETCLDAGAPGITVHPRADARHIRESDVVEIAAFIADRNAGAAGPDGAVEFNVEGDPRPELIDLVLRVHPDQCTLVPVAPGEITSQAGWRPGDDVREVVARLKAAGVRVSLFVEAAGEPVRWAADMAADRVELYTEPFARACVAGESEAAASFATYTAAAELAHSLGLGVNAGHDLDTSNLRLFRKLPHLSEVSIGHALVSRALWVGLDRAVREYLHVLRAIE
jgi:pyridoxine 5-phosphate synthase